MHLKEGDFLYRGPMYLAINETEVVYVFSNTSHIAQLVFFLALKRVTKVLNYREIFPQQTQKMVDLQEVWLL